MRTKSFLALLIVLLSFSCKNQKEKQQSKEVVLSGKAQVFGFHPYWVNGETYTKYNYSCLSAISYFSAELDPRTGLIDTNKLEDARALFQLARGSGCQLYLTVSNFGKEKHRVFLKSPEAQLKFIEVVSEFLSTREFDGLTIDFDAIPGDLSKEFTWFIKSVSDELNVQNKSIVLALPGMDTTHSYDILVLEQYVTSYVVGKNGYSGDWRSTAGAVAPLRAKAAHGISLERIVDNYLNIGIPKSKLILALPYYGSLWKIPRDAADTTQPQFVEHLSYKTIRSIHPNTPSYDSITETAYLTVNDTTQIWFDDPVTLSKKYDYINEIGLAGVAIWALGYDEGYTELWDVLCNTFMRADTLVVSVNETSSIDQ